MKVHMEGEHEEEGIGMPLCAVLRCWSIWLE